MYAKLILRNARRSLRDYLIYIVTLTLALVIGMGLGVFVSELITAMLLSTYGQPFRIIWSLFPDTALLTVCFFLASFAVIGAFNVRHIRSIKVTDMLRADKENEQSFSKSKWMPAVTLLFAGVLVWMLVTAVSNLLTYYDARFPAAARIVFWGNAAVPAAGLFMLSGFLCAPVFRIRRNFSVLVFMLMLACLPLIGCAGGVLMLQQNYSISMGQSAERYLLFILMVLIFAVSAVFYLISGFIVRLKEKSVERRYRNNNLFLFGQILAKLRSTSKTMTLICITLMLSIVLFLAAPVLAGWSSGYLEARAVYDVQISSRYNNVYEEGGLPDTTYEEVSAYLEQQGAVIRNECLFQTYLPQAQEFRNRFKFDFPELAVSLSDYNCMLNLIGEGPVTLSEGEYGMQWQTIAPDEEIRQVISRNPEVKTDREVVRLAADSVYQKSLGEVVYNSYTDVIYIFPDSVAENLLGVTQHRYILTAEPLPYQEAAVLEDIFTAIYPENVEEGNSYSIRLKTLQVNGSLMATFILKSGMLYTAVVLLITCFTILALQQLSDAAHYRYRFGVLRRMGVEEADVRRLVLRQLGVWFGLPVGIAVISASILAASLFAVLWAEISAYIGTAVLFLQIGATAGILALLLLCYFVSTWHLFRRSIED